MGVQLTTILLLTLSTLSSTADTPASISGTDTAALSDCTCFKTNSSSDGKGEPAYFTNYYFIDFRDLGDAVAAPARVEEADDDDGGGEDADGDDGGEDEETTAGYFDSDGFTDSWDIQTWRQSAARGDPDTSTYELANSARNVFVDRDSSTSPTFLTLRTYKLSTFQSSSEIDTTFNMTYASLRSRFRVSGSAGGVAGLFFYRNETSESDIEILTRDETNLYHASNQPTVDDSGNEIPDSSTPLGSSGVKDYTQWNEYRLDWLSERTSWMSNGVHDLDKTYGVPVGACSVNVNMWGNGGEWSGVMEDGDEARMDIAWLEIVYNATDGGVGCGDGAKICTVDREGGMAGTVVTGEVGAGSKVGVSWAVVWSGLAVLVLMGV